MDDNFAFSSEIVDVISGLRENVTDGGKVTLEQLDRLGGVKMSAGMGTLCFSSRFGFAISRKPCHHGACDE